MPGTVLRTLCIVVTFSLPQYEICMRFQFCFTGKKRLGTIQIAQSHPSKVYKRVQGNLGFYDSNLSLNTFLWAFETRTSFVFYLRQSLTVLLALAVLNSLCWPQIHIEIYLPLPPKLGLKANPTMSGLNLGYPENNCIFKNPFNLLIIKYAYHLYVSV